MANAVPGAVLGISIGVIIYSLLSLSTSLLLFSVLMVRREWSSYVTFIAFFVSLSTAASIAQQAHYAADWRNVKTAQFIHAQGGGEGLPMAAKFGSSHVGQAVPFYIQYFCYNVLALFCLLWAFDLFTGSWNLRITLMRSAERYVAITAKAAAILLPGLIVGLVQIPAIVRNRPLFLVLANLAMVMNFALGGIAVVLTLSKYISTRRFLTRNVYGSYGSSSGAPSIRQSMDDRWLVIRFSLAFFCLSGYEAWIVVFQVMASQETVRVKAATAPDLSLDGTKSDIVGFIPGATASLMIFIIFGTTKPLRHHYGKMIQSARRRLLCAPDRRSATPRRHPTRRLDRKLSLATQIGVDQDDNISDVEMVTQSSEFNRKWPSISSPTLPEPAFQPSRMPAEKHSHPWPAEAV